MRTLRRFTRALLMGGAAAALLAAPALAAEPSEAEILRLATVSEETALLDTEDTGAELALLPKGAELVLLERGEDGTVLAAYEAEDDVLTGYVASEAVSVQSLGRTTVLTEQAALMDIPGDGGEVLLNLMQDCPVLILGHHDGWYCVQARGITGYLPETDVLAELTTTSSLNLREEADADSERLDTIPSGTGLTPVDGTEGWYQVTYEGQTGYISAEYVSVPEEYEVEDPTMSDGEAVLAYAQQFLGNRYVWGGTSLTNGCDCSGYVMQIYAQFGVSLPHSSYAIRGYGEKVSYSEMQVGDVVCYNGHVGIYAGDGQIINALNSRKGICYTNVNYAPIVTIRRML